MERVNSVELRNIFWYVEFSPPKFEDGNWFGFWRTRWDILLGFETNLSKTNGIITIKSHLFEFVRTISSASLINYYILRFLFCYFVRYI